MSSALKLLRSAPFSARLGMGMVLLALLAGLPCALLLRGLSQDCIVVAPSLIPSRPGEPRACSQVETPCFLPGR